MQIGDIVVVKSGGPRMTIDRISGTSGEGTKIFRCVWFVDGIMHGADLIEKSLETKDGSTKQA